MEPTTHQQPHQQHPQQRNKHLGSLLLLVALVLAWIFTPMLIALQEDKALYKQQQEQQRNTFRTNLTRLEAQLKEYESKSTSERFKIIGAIPEAGKASQPNILREIETILTGTNAKLRGISFDTGNYSVGSGPKALPINIELDSPDAGTILQILKKFEGATRLYSEEGMTLNSTESGVSAQLRLNVYSRE